MATTTKAKGRKKEKKETISFYASKSVMSRIEQNAEDKNITRSNSVNDLLEEYLSVKNRELTNPPTIIIVENHKGGVGKTVTSCELAYCLGQLGRKVLAIDMDGQGNMSFVMQAWDPEARNLSIADIMITAEDGSRREIDEVIVPSPYRNVDLVPANLNFTSADVKLRLELGGATDMRLKYALGTFQRMLDAQTAEWVGEDLEVLNRPKGNVRLPRCRFKVRARSFDAINPRDHGNIIAHTFDQVEGDADREVSLSLQYDTEENARLAYNRYSTYDGIISIEPDNARSKADDRVFLERECYPYRWCATYDYIIIDCPPAVNSVLANAVVAMSEGSPDSQVVIPINPEMFSVLGIQETIALVKSTSRSNQLPQPKIKALWTMVKESEDLWKVVPETLDEEFPDLPIYETVINYSGKVKESTSTATSINLHSPSSAPARKYMRLAREIDGARKFPVNIPTQDVLGELEQDGD